MRRWEGLGWRRGCYPFATRISRDVGVGQAVDGAAVVVVAEVAVDPLAAKRCRGLSGDL